jgi:hypothetical protein
MEAAAMISSGYSVMYAFKYNYKKITIPPSINCQPPLSHLNNDHSLKFRHADGIYKMNYNTYFTQIMSPRIPYLINIYFIVYLLLSVITFNVLNM